MNNRTLMIVTICAILLPIGVNAKSPSELTDEEVLNLRPDSKELKERLMWEYPQLTDSNELSSGAQDVVEMYPNDPEWIAFFGKLLKDPMRREAAMLALGNYKARAYEKEILSLVIEKKEIIWDALYSLVAMNSPLLPTAVTKARVLLREKPDANDSALLTSVEKAYRAKQKK